MPKNEPERRSFPVELRVSSSSRGPRIVGHAAVFDTLSGDLGGFREKIDPGAFDTTLTNDVRALFNHDPNFVLGRTKAGTLALTKDETGLRYDVTPPDTQWAKDLMVSIDRGDISQSSFAFRTIEDKWETKGEENIRTLLAVELLDVSPVTSPAYESTTVAKRSLDYWKAKGTGEDPLAEQRNRLRRYEIENADWKGSTDQD